MAIALAESAFLTVISLVLVTGTCLYLPFGPHHTVVDVVYPPGYSYSYYSPGPETDFHDDSEFRIFAEIR